MNIIGITGYAGSGKDTVANILVRDHGFVKIAFADPLKRICKDVFDFSDEQLWGPSSARNGEDKRYPRPLQSVPDSFQSYLTPRHALQQLGTEWGRACYENVWVDYVLRVADRLANGKRHEGNWYSAQEGIIFVGGLDRPKGIVISDVRFPNEVSVLKAKAKNVRIWRTVHGTGLIGAAGAHLSEQHIDNIEADFTFPAGGLDALPKAVKAAMLHEHWQPAWHTLDSGSPPDIHCEGRSCIDFSHFGGRLPQ